MAVYSSTVGLPISTLPVDSGAEKSVAGVLSTTEVIAVTHLQFFGPKYLSRHF